MLIPSRQVHGHGKMTEGSVKIDPTMNIVAAKMDIGGGMTGTKGEMTTETNM